jgi:hypothetical protein
MAKLEIRSGGSGGGGTPGTSFSSQAVSGNITLSSDKVFLVDTTAARSLTLPAAAEASHFYLKDASGFSSSNVITIVRAGSEQIEGVAANKTLRTDFGCWEFWCNGTNWFII